ncbi:PaaX family transcriptional regulator [Streptomyces sp. XM4193]|uniref:PaaX family transcriptional regulator n=1 Tax=Streptomyces sp. XM4193 TaxID=2929782 RepID=UPI001FFC1794|nr:PaaX family transcriptional regulator C-terminal domain-containing protein [Streptomyces sp. XM4193]MCK1797034.1 PaaX family transcriptional regulator [Streptomyces sp. XM4193]
MADQHTPGSLVLTFFGAYGRELTPSGRLPIAALIRLLGAVGVDAPAVRSAVSRLKRRGLLEAGAPEGARADAGYALSPAAAQLLADGDRRIYQRPVPDGRWLVAVFSVPESERDRRHLLRSRLGRLGFGNAAPGVWVAPSHLAEETRHTLRRLELAEYVDLFLGTHEGFRPSAETAARWWDLESIAARHRDFLAVHEPVLAALESDGPTAESGYAAYLRALDAWRQLRYADPGLPDAVLPPHWPGTRSEQVFGELHKQLHEPGARYAASRLAPG